MRNTVMIPALLALSVGLAACSHQPNVNLENAKTNFSALQTNPEATRLQPWKPRTPANGWTRLRRLT